MWAQMIVGTIAVAVVYLYFYTKRAYRYFEERGIKYLRPVPLFGNFFKSTFRYTHLIDDLDEIYKAFPDEKYVGAFEFYSPIILIRDPEIIKKITVKDFDHFLDHRQFVDVDTDKLFGSSLLFLKGEKWRDMRSTLSPAFTGSKMRQMLPFINDIARQIVTHLKREVKPTDEGFISSELNMEDLLKRYATDVIASCAFGHKINSVEDKTNKFYLMGKSISDFTFIQKIKMTAGFLLPSFTKTLNISIFPKSTTEFFTEMVSGTMKYRKDNAVFRPDMIQLLMEAKDGTLIKETKLTDDKVGFASEEESKVNNRAVTRKWSDVELAGQAFVFFFAGFDTTSSVMTFSVHELAINPEAQSRLRDEIDECHANNAELTYEALQGLKYLDMVISETMRKWSPAIIMDRTVVKEYTLEPPRPGAQPVTIKKKDIVYNLVNALHMDEKYFPEPHKFDPERFSDERKHEIKPFTYMPFGIGPRNCIGSRFALMEIKVLLYHLLLEFEVLSCSKTTNPLRLQPLDFNVRVANGSYLKLKSRK